MYKCDICKEEFLRDEVTFLCEGEEVLLSEEGGSGDIDTTLCDYCRDKLLEDIFGGWL